MRFIAAALVASLVALPAAGHAQDTTGQPTTGQPVTVTHAVSQFGPPLYGPDFEHFDYVNPDAPKGGATVLGAFGTFDSLNWIPLQGTWPEGIGLIYDSLMTGSADELTSAYGLIAETAEYPEDLSWVIFNIRDDAVWHDGTPITAHDVKWTFDKIQEVGRPLIRAAYQQIAGVDVLSDKKVRFNLYTKGRMGPILTAAGFTPMPRHWWEAEGRDIAGGTLEPVLGSGPYRVSRLDAGRSITFERVPDYWAAALPVNVGRHNIGAIRYDYYRDMDIMTEAFLGGAYDFHTEFRAQTWVTGYDTPAVRAGYVVREAVPDRTLQGMQGWFFNTRRPIFDDVRVRQALSILYDFETVQRQVLYGKYQRTSSYFPNSELASSGIPEGLELEILEPYRDQLPEQLFTEPFRPPETPGTGNIRPQLREAMRLLREAGWEVRDGVLTNAETGERMSFEILLRQQNVVRVTQPYVRNLARAGARASIRVVDSAQYQVRTDNWQYDMLSVRLNNFFPPGTEQLTYWSSEAANTNGSGNLAGIEDPVVDALLEELLATPDVTEEDYERLVAITRALDRVLLWGFYVVPAWYNDETWIAFWDRFGRPDELPRYGVGFPDVWWIDLEKAAEIAAVR